LFDLETSEVTFLTDGDKPAWHPDGSSIAFVGQNPDGGFDVYEIELDASEVTFVTGGTDPAWSPDGMRLAITGQADVGLAVYIVEPGSEAVMITPGESPTWSPDGTQIALVDTG
jgi:Tol biopolymer transport system component